jgi:N-acetylmuramoyl-L-alanine amidase
MKRPVFTLALLVLGCTAGGPPPAGVVPAAGPGSAPLPPPSSASHLSPVPPVRGPLAIRVIYPAATDVVDARDSSFLFGSLGTGDARLTVNGTPVPVWPNGAWLAWVALPPDSVMNFALEARTPTDSASLTWPVRRARRFVPPDSGVWLDSLSIRPRGRVWWPRAEWLPVSVRAVPGATVGIRWPDGRLTPLAPDLAPEELPAAIRAFDRDSTHLRPVISHQRYVGAVRGLAVGADPGPIVGGPQPSTSCPMMASGGASCPMSGRASPQPMAIAPPPPVIEAIVGTDTARASWNIQLGLTDSLPVEVVLDDDTAGTGTTDQLTVGRALPGGTYQWFFPTGTHAAATARLGDDLRLALSRGSVAWINVADAQPLPAGLPQPRAVIESVTLTPGRGSLLLRIPASVAVPYLVTEGDRSLTVRLYGAVGDVNWMRYGGTDPYVTAMAWDQPASDEVTITLSLASPLWGYRAHWAGNDLLLEIRRPPEIDASHPLAGRRIVVDPGHPPVGATGPTGLREADANLAVALRLRDLLAEAGARVLMTRTSDTAVDLWPRVHFADSVDAELLISIHNNALPDGVEPFRNNGSSVFYNQPQSVALAMDIQQALVRLLGLRDLGVGRGDLALVRPTWMPAVLCEGLFMMIPDQEAALRSPQGQSLYARAVYDGVVRFLEQRAGM